jgi:hypothetical protein
MQIGFFRKRAVWASTALALLAGMPCAAGSITFTTINDPNSSQNTDVRGINNSGAVGPIVREAPLSASPTTDRVIQP